jgi:beta-lactam-binding protein with PASTA domain
MDTIATQLLARNPDERYRDATELVEELDGALQSLEDGNDTTVEQRIGGGREPEEEDPSITETVEATVPSTVRVPDLTGQDAFQASGALVEAGLTLGDQEEVASETVPKGKIVGQSIVAGTEAERGGLVSATVSSGPEESDTEEVQEETQNYTNKTTADTTSDERREGRDDRSARAEDREHSPPPSERRGGDESRRRKTFRRPVGMSCLVLALVIVVVSLWVLSLLAQGGQAMEKFSVYSQTLASARQELGDHFEIVGSNETAMS